MLWTADSISITADGICWTADGFNGCVDVPVTIGEGGGDNGGLRDALWDEYNKEQNIQANNNMILAVVSNIF